MERKKEFTPEEKAAYAELQQQRKDDLETRVKDLVSTFQNSDSFKEYLSKMGEFSRTCNKYLHHYSPNNILLAIMQYPQASIIGSFGAWKKMGRNVKAGEKAKMYIWAPIKGPAMRDKLDENGKPILDEDGKREREVVKDSRGKTVYQISGGFVLKPVFDVSQTDGEPLPSLTSELTNPVDNFDTYMKVLRDISPLPIFMSNEQGAEGFDLGPAKGVCAYSLNKIIIRDGMAEEQTLKTAIHEITHAIIHAPETLEKTAEGKDRFTQQERECQAEGTAYVVCDHLGFDTSDYSIPYIFSWSHDDGMTAFTHSLDVILHTSDQLIEQIEEKLAKELGLETTALEPTPEMLEARRIMEEWTMPRETPLLLGMPPAENAQEQPTVEELADNKPLGVDTQERGTTASVAEEPVIIQDETLDPNAPEPTIHPAIESNKMNPAISVDFKRIMRDPTVAKLLESGYEMSYIPRVSLGQGGQAPKHGLVFEKQHDLYSLRVEAMLLYDVSWSHYMPDFSSHTTSLYAFDNTTNGGHHYPKCFFVFERDTLSNQMGALRENEHYQNLRALDEGGFRLWSSNSIMGEASYVKFDVPYEAKLKIPYLPSEEGGLRLDFSEHDLVLMVSKGDEMLGSAVQVGNVKEAISVFENKKTLDQEMGKMVQAVPTSYRRSSGPRKTIAQRDLADAPGQDLSHVIQAAKQSAKQRNNERVSLVATHPAKQDGIQL